MSIEIQGLENLWLVELVAPAENFILPLRGDAVQYVFIKAESGEVAYKKVEGVPEVIAARQKHGDRLEVSLRPLRPNTLSLVFVDDDDKMVHTVHFTHPEDAPRTVTIYFTRE